ncbi:MAG TPA: DUF1641 domain-containing protein [Aigarchaeota archaeon]|nr:DUF1641 domain-containing protein [Aigarchaeota archaeon]
MTGNGVDFVKSLGIREELAENLDEKLELLLFFLDALDSFIKRSPVIFESLNNDIIKMREQLRGGDPKALFSLMEFALSEEFAGLVEGIKSAYYETKENDYRTSLTGLVRSITDEDIQRALAFILLALKRIGQNLGR